MRDGASGAIAPTVKAKTERSDDPDLRLVRVRTLPNFPQSWLSRRTSRYSGNMSRSYPDFSMICECLPISDLGTQSSEILEACPDFFPGAKPEKVRKKRMLTKVGDGIVIIMDLKKMYGHICIDCALEEGRTEGKNIGPRA